MSARKLVKRELARIDAIDEDPPALRIVEAEQEIDDRRLPAPVWPTSATVSPGRAVKDTPLSTHSGFGGGAAPAARWARS